MTPDTLRCYTHAACLQHEPGTPHVEVPARLRAVLDALDAADPALRWHDAPLASRDQLLRVHRESLVSTVLDTHVDRGCPPVELDPDTAIGAGSGEAALRAAGAGIAAVDAALTGETLRAFCAVRPPGHHASADVAMGFCLFNNIAVAAAHACAAHGLQRVAIADFDVHHGNGTQAIFQSDPRIMFASSHQMPLFPDTGDAREHGIGNVINAPLPPGAGSRDFREAWAGRLLPALDAFRPQLLLVSAGFDGHRADPLADLALEVEDFAWISGELVALAGRHGGGRLVSMLEGGYELAALGDCCVAHVAALR